MHRRIWLTAVVSGAVGLSLLAAACSSISCSSSLVEFDPYPIYPLRRDPIVIANPSQHPTSPAPAGQLDQWIREHIHRGGRIVDPSLLSTSQQSEIEKELDQLFGTPSLPRVDSPHAAELGLIPVELAEGSRLYRRHCANCHGISGDGRGPAGLFVYPHARDLRHGVIKYATTENGTPTRDDLKRIIKAGVPGTSMPPFGLADDTTIDRLASATIHLSLRGDVERKLIEQVLSDDPPEDLALTAKDLLTRAVDRFRSAQSVALPGQIPPVSDDRIRNGLELFRSPKTGCLSCHDDFGRADSYRFDVWGTASKVANLTDRSFRGGAEPQHLFLRVKFGIPAVGMPAQTTLTDDELWDLTWFLLHLPKPMQLPEDVRSKVYPNS